MGWADSPPAGTVGSFGEQTGLVLSAEEQVQYGRPTTATVVNSAKLRKIIWAEGFICHAGDEASVEFTGPQAARVTLSQINAFALLVLKDKKWRLIGLAPAGGKAPVSARGVLLKPEPERAASMWIFEGRIKFAGLEDASVVRIDRANIKGIQYDGGQRRASVGTMAAFGLMGAIAGKRTMTTVGIEKTDGEIIIFRWKGKDTMHVTMALDQFMARLEQDSASSTEAVGEFCAAEQIASMARAGLTDAQIKAACREGG